MSAVEKCFATVDNSLSRSPPRPKNKKKSKTFAIKDLQSQLGQQRQHLAYLKPWCTCPDNDLHAPLRAPPVPLLPIIEKTPKQNDLQKKKTRKKKTSQKSQKKKTIFVSSASATCCRKKPKKKTIFTQRNKRKKTSPTSCCLCACVRGREMHRDEDRARECVCVCERDMHRKRQGGGEPYY